MSLITRLLLAAALLSAWTLRAAAESPRATIARAVLTEDAAEQRKLIGTLAGQGDEVIPELLAAWRTDAIFLHLDGGTTVPVQLVGEKDAAGSQAALRVDNGEPLVDAAGEPMRLVGRELKTADHTSALRRAMKAVLDLFDLVSANPVRRLMAVQTIGQAQDASKIAVLEERLPLEKDAKVRRALREALALIRLKDANDAMKLAALAELKELKPYTDNGYANRNWNDTTNLVITGKAGLQIMGDWARGEFAAAGMAGVKDFGCMIGLDEDNPIVSTDGDVIVFPKQKDPEKEAAQKRLAALLISPKVQVAFNNAKGSMPVRGDVDMATADPCMQKALKAVEDPKRIATGVQRFITEDTSNQLNSLITQYWADDSMTADAAQKKFADIIKNSD